jgi:hypothetical protein
MEKIDRNNLFIIALIVLSTLLPFINKPFNVDDPFYLTAANQLAKDPAHPYSYSINWSGELRNAWVHMEATFPPLITAYTALVIKTAGQNEIMLHLFFLLFPLAASVSMYFIAKKFTVNPLFTTLIFTACPSFLVSATSIMLDIPLCAFMLSSMAFYIYGADEDDKLKLLSGGMLDGCAILSKYSGILLVPIIFSYLFFTKKTKYTGYLIIPFVFLGLWSLHNEIIYKGIHFLLASNHIGKGISLHKIFAFGPFFSGCIIFPVALMFLASLKDVRAIIVWAVTLFILAKIVIGSTTTAVMFAIFSTAAVYFIYKILIERKKLDKFLLVWFFTGIAAVMLLEPWLSARYLLVIVPPCAIIFAKILDGIAEKSARFLWYITLCVVFLSGISLAVSDYLWADSYKQAARYVKDKGYNKGYFVGHFGLQYYLEKAGMTALEVNKPLLGAGFIVAARNPDPQRPSQEIMSAIKLIELKPFQSRFPLRLMNSKLRAGFYSSYWGILPFNFSDEPLDEIAIFKIREGNKK